ncbi:hypothetical protein SDC9_90919 [bioreactor metagenome]|uniref:Glycosyltransferase RgtA/B/C/D-like domain-containing protein n=1 Tax=bioreactor metagenome TaxID=1076179 RepID=A0A644ZWE0_9ZZZZ
MVFKKDGQTLCLAALSAVLLLYLASFAVINFFGFMKFCNSDMYQDITYAMLAWRDKSFFPQGWVFGNQYYVFTTPVLCALFYGLTSNASFSMALATTVMTGLILLSMWYLLRPFTDGVGCLVGVTAMAGCMITANAAESLEGQLFYVLASYYAGYLITMLVVIGDYSRAVCFENKRGFSLSLVLSSVLCFAAGMQSFRLTAVLILPLMAAELLRMFTLQQKKESEKWGRALAVPGRVLLYEMSNLAGAVYIAALRIPQVTIYGSLGPRALSDWKNAYAINSRIFSKLTGFFYTQTEELSLPYYALSLLFIGVVVCAALVTLYRYISERRIGICNRKSLFGVIVIVVFGISIVGLFAMNLLCDINFRTPYLFIWYPFTAILCAIFVKMKNTSSWRNAAVALLCAGFVGNWAVGYASEVQQSLEPRETSILKVVSDFVVEQGFTYVYGDLAITGPIAAYTNGRVLAASSYGNALEILPYINPQGVYGEAENQNAVYVFRGRDDIEALEYAKTIDARMTLVAEYSRGYYTLYTSDKPLMHYGSMLTASTVPRQ